MGEEGRKQRRRRTRRSYQTWGRVCRFEGARLGSSDRQVGCGLRCFAFLPSRTYLCCACLTRVVFYIFCEGLPCSLMLLPSWTESIIFVLILVNAIVSQYRAHVRSRFWTTDDDPNSMPTPVRGHLHTWVDYTSCVLLSSSRKLFNLHAGMPPLMVPRLEALARITLVVAAVIFRWATWPLPHFLPTKLRKARNLRYVQPLSL